ncbi:hypothetical protein GEO60473_16890 [Geobacter sp. 60473]|nr:hypothetical protein GEO60473_16890 [Geobacter sp. 60473]
MGLALDEPADNDERMVLNGIEVAVTSNFRSLLDDQILDYITNEHGEGLVFRRESGDVCC